MMREFQNRVGDWMQECFGPEISADKVERNDRFLEEAIELVQACGYTADRAHALVRYVFSRPAGEPGQEVGGVMVTLAALCNVQGLDIEREATREVDRITTPEMVAKIRAKQAAKPTGSALPIAVPGAASEQVSHEVLQERLRQIDGEGWTPEHDDSHRSGELVQAAIVYAEHAIMPEQSRPHLRPTGWPWDDQFWRPADRRRELVKAAALLQAEIERIDRVDARGAAG